jgi:hypothetical protein
MDRVEEIESEIEALAPEEFSRIARWFRERDQALWDRQVDADSVSGKLDFLFEEAAHESGHGLLRKWPASK